MAFDQLSHHSSLQRTSGWNGCRFWRVMVVKTPGNYVSHWPADARYLPQCASFGLYHAVSLSDGGAYHVWSRDGTIEPIHLAGRNVPRDFMDIINVAVAFNRKDRISLSRVGVSHSSYFAFFRASIYRIGTSAAIYG